MADVDEQLRSYSSWLAEEADRKASEQDRRRTVSVVPIRSARHRARRWWPLAAVAAVSILVVSLVVMVGTREAQAPADEPSTPTAPRSPAPTTAPPQTTAPTTPAPAPTTTTPATTTPPATAPPVVIDGAIDPALVPRDVDEEMVRPLADLAADDVVAPAYVPQGMVFDGPATSSDHDFSFALRTVDRSKYVWVRQGSVTIVGGPDGARPVDLDPATLTDPDHPPVEIAGITWGWFEFESARVAHIGASAIYVGVSDLDEEEARRFIEGLRATSIEQFPGPIMFDIDDGLSLVDRTASDAAEVVASDPEFELLALRVGDYVCTKLRQTVVPVTMGFAANCDDAVRVSDWGIVDLYSLDDSEGTPDTPYLVIGMVDSVTSAAARVTSPSGDSVVVATGPVNEAVDGRFFLARLDVDDTAGVRLDHFEIEDASP